MPKSETAGIDKTDGIIAESAGDIDDDVIDLLEVVKSGKSIPHLTGEDDLDFSADLDSMLDTLSQAEQARDKAAPEVFPDPTPVDYEVDYNENLDLPGMKDLDTIFNSLGAKSAPEQPQPASYSSGIDDLEPEHTPDLDHLDARPAAGQRKAATHDELDDDDGILNGTWLDDNLVIAPDANDDASLADAAHAPDAPPTTFADAPATPGTPPAAAPAPSDHAAPLSTSDRSDLWQAAIGQVAAGQVAGQDDEPAQDAAAPRFNEVDLNELDALLDDMLASAPASGPASTPAAPLPAEPDPDFFTAQQPDPAPQVVTAPQPEPAPQVDLATLHEMGADIAALRDDVEALKQQTDSLRPDEAEADIATLRDDVEALKKRTASLEGANIAALRDDMEALKQQTDSLRPDDEAEADIATLRDDVEALKKRVDSLEGADIAALRNDVEALKKQIASLQPEEAAPSQNDIFATLQNHAASIAAHAAHMAELEKLLTANTLQDNEKTDEIDGLAKRVTDIEERLNNITRQFITFSANIDNIAAEAAARVIREEITALLDEDTD